MFTQTFDNMMLPSKTHVLGTPRIATRRLAQIGAEDAARELDEKYNVDCRSRDSHIK